MSRFVLPTIAALGVAAFLFSLDPLLGFLLAIGGLVWAAMPFTNDRHAVAIPVHDRLYLE